MEPNEVLADEYFAAVWSTGDMAAQARLVASDYEGYWLIDGMPVRRGPAEHRAWLENVRRGLPDAHYTIHELIAAGDRLVARVTLTGTHLGVVAGQPPTGKRATVEQIFVLHVAAGQIVREWVSFDRASFMRQLTPGADG